MRAGHQWKKNVLHVAAALLSTVAFADAWAHQPGRMTGGGSIICPDIGRVTHGFELHCGTNDPGFDNPPLPNNLEINFSNGNNFHLTSLEYAYCIDDASIVQAPPAAWFDTMHGVGGGTFNGVPALVYFKLVDAGEPGSADLASFRIDVGGVQTVLDCGPLPLDRGNQQAHDSTGSKQ